MANYDKLTISLPKKLTKNIRKMSRGTGRTVSGLIRISVQKFIEQEFSNDYNE